jgi:hypothetical protein
MTSAIDEFFVKSEVCYHHVICNMTFYCELPTAVDFIEHFSLYISFWLSLFLWFLFDVSILSVSIQYLVALCVWTKYYFQLQSKLNFLLKDLFLKLPRIIIISTDISQKLKTAESFVVVLMFWKLIPAKIQAQASQISKARLLNFPSKNFVKGYNCKVYLFIYLFI